MRSKRNLLNPIYKALGTGSRHGLLRPSFPTFGGPRGELAVPLESGMLHDIAVVIFA